MIYDQLKIQTHFSRVCGTVGNLLGLIAFCIAIFGGF